MTYEESPSEYLRKIGVKYKSVGKNEVRFPCPMCNDDEGFSFNLRSGLWVCMRATCGEKGNLHSMKVARGDAYQATHAPVQRREEPPISLVMAFGSGRKKTEDETESETEVETLVDTWRRALLESDDAQAAREYLRSRGFRLVEGALELARLGWFESLPGGASSSGGVSRQSRRPGRPGRPHQTAPVLTPGVIAIPYPTLELTDDRFDDPTMVKLRLVPPEPLDQKGRPIRYRRIAGGSTTLYAPAGIDWEKPLLLCGGELDCLSVLEAAYLSGTQPEDLEFSIAAPSSESSWGAIGDIADELKDDVIIVFDNDDAGIAASERAAASIGRWRCRIGHWPEGFKDANDALCSGELDLFSLQALVKDAQSTVAAGIAPTQVFADRLIARLRRDGSSGWSTGWYGIDKLLGGGLKPGHTTVITGHTSSGKSIAVSQIANVFAQRHQRVWFCPFELTVDGQLERTVWQWVGRDPQSMVDYDIRKTLDEIGDRILWFDHYGAVEIEAFSETLLYVVRRLDVDLVVLDHRDFMARRGDRERWNRLDELMMSVVSTIERSTAHCLLVVHPSKPSSAKKDRDDWIPQLGDAKGHSDIYQDVHNYAAMYRPRSTDRSEKPGPDGCYDAAIVVMKVRDPRGGEGTVQLRFDNETQRYYDGGKQSAFE